MIGTEPLQVPDSVKLKEQSTVLLCLVDSDEMWMPMLMEIKIMSIQNIGETQSVCE